MMRVGGSFGDIREACWLIPRAKVRFIDSRALPTSDAFPTAFNSLSFQYVSRTLLSLQGNTFWDLDTSYV